MNTVKAIGIVIVTAAVVFMVWLFFRHSTRPPEGAFRLASPRPTFGQAPQAPTATPSVFPVQTLSPTPTPAAVIIEITSVGFSPASVTIAPGTTVEFVNKDTDSHWPASAVHPIHNVCPGFDALRGLVQDESYSFTFTEQKECPYHDHLRPSLKGTIRVQ